MVGSEWKRLKHCNQLQLMKWKEVTRDEFYAYIEAYPRPLDVDICGITDPPTVSYDDVTLGNWPESLVAKYFREYEPGETNTYYLR